MGKKDKSLVEEMDTTQEAEVRVRVISYCTFFCTCISYETHGHKWSCGHIDRPPSLSSALGPEIVLTFPKPNIIQNY